MSGNCLGNEIRITTEYSRMNGWNERKNSYQFVFMFQNIFLLLYNSQSLGSLNLIIEKVFVKKLQHVSDDSFLFSFKRILFEQQMDSYDKDSFRVDFV